MTKPRDDLPVEYVASSFNYDPSTGELVWKHRPDMSPQWNGKFVGRVAGTINDRGYVIVAIYGKDYRAHRIAWAISTGAWPDHEIDHRNMIKSDNRLANLRESTHVQNNYNKPAQSNNTSGYKGVSFSKTMKRWVARISVAGRYTVVGYADTPDEAACLYRTHAAAAHGAFKNITV